MEVLKFGGGNIPVHMISSTWMEIYPDKVKQRFKVYLETCGGKVFYRSYDKEELASAEEMLEMIIDKIKCI